MKHRGLRFIILLAISLSVVLSACQASPQPVVAEATRANTGRRVPLLFDTAEPTPPPPLRPERTATPSAAPRPTITLAELQYPSLEETPAPVVEELLIPQTSLPGLVETRPYLVYFGQEGGKPAVILMNQNLEGRRVLPLPDGALPPRLPEALSPGGTWLAFQTDQPEHALYLMRLPDGQITKITDFLNVHSIEWDDAGRNLAFAGQVNETQQGLYMYDRWNSRLVELVLSPDPILWLRWTQGADYILYSVAKSECADDCGNWYMVGTRTGQVRQFTGIAAPEERASLTTWVNTSTALIRVRGQDRTTVKRLNILRGTLTEVYSNAFDDYVYDPQTDTYAVTLSYDVNTGQALDEGIYLFRPQTGQQRLIAPFAQYNRLDIRRWDRYPYRFLLHNDAEIFRVTYTGEVTPFARGRLMDISPDATRLVVANIDVSPPSLQILSADGQIIRETSAEPLGDLFWNLNGDGLFSIYQGQLYYLSMNGGEWQLVDGLLPRLTNFYNSPMLYGWKKY